VTLLRVSHLARSFGGVKAVDDVSFDLHAGQLLALIGPNGAGKSTCFNMLNGQLRPSSGSILFDDHEIAGKRPRDIWRLGVGRTFQIAATFNSMTVIENVQMALVSRDRQLFNLWKPTSSIHADEAIALLEQVGMAAHAKRACGVLAYGDVKRVELAIALANKPKLLFTEHSMDVVFAYADKLIVLARGKLIGEGDAETVRNDPRVREVYFGTGKSFTPRASLAADGVA
jgi:branched-chain amino acid transport system ATP-binding protein